jgi:hypothetical protein
LGSAPAQSVDHSPGSLLARLSHSGAFVSPQVCFALYRDGYYRVLRMTRDGTESLQGTLPQDELIRLRTMLNNLDFQSGGGGIVRQASESLIVEVVREGEAVDYVWVDPDHKRPFPPSAISLVKWLQGFQAQGASPLATRELSDQPICPAGSEIPVPVIASLRGLSAGSSTLGDPPALPGRQ